MTDFPATCTAFPKLRALVRFRPGALLKPLQSSTSVPVPQPRGGHGGNQGGNWRG